MNNIYKLSIILIVIACLNSCNNDFLNLNPKTQLSEEVFFKTPDDFKSALNGTYSVLQEGNMYGSSWYVFSEIPSDNTSNQLSGSVSDQDEFDKFYIRTLNPYLANFWNSSYNGIHRANTIITRIDVIEMDVDLKERYKLEATFLRALMYYNLVRVFGDVPLIKEPITIQESYQLTRTKVEDIYTSIIADLKLATKLPTSYTGNDIGRTTSGAAKSLLGSIYMTQSDFKKAQTVFEEVIQSGKYQLLENTPGDINIDGYASVFDPNNHNHKESIFDVQFKKGGFGEGSGFANNFAPENSGTNVVPVGGTGGNNLPTMDMYNAYEDNDLRRDYSMALGYYNAQNSNKWVNALHITKYKDTPYQSYDSNNNWPVIRYADVLLMYAEALNENGETSKACDYLNMVRRRGFGYNTNEVSPYDMNTIDKNAFKDMVDHERRVELAFEGHRWFDLIRTKKAVELMKSKGFKLNATNLICPIPQEQIDLNKNLTQNEYIIEPK